ncbi:MAG TPA: polysaccharide deacetylase family protein [Gemmatimonadaceae bacterium]
MRAILTYHSIDDSGSPISIDEAAFRRHVEWLASGAVRVLPLDQILRPPPGRVIGAELDAVAITFDDGLESIERVALPLLRDYALPATVFLVSSAMGRTNVWRGNPDPRIPQLPVMDWNAACRLVDAGIAVGAHSRTHPHLSRLSAAQIEAEVLGSCDRIRQEVGLNVTTFAYPYGDADDRVRAVVARHCELACGTELRALREQEKPHWLPRIDAYYVRSRGRLESWGSARFRLFLDVQGRARRLREQLVRSA